MKKWIMLAIAAFAVAGCNQGGTLDEYGTETGTTGTNLDYQPTLRDTNTGAPANNQGAGTSPGGMNSGMVTNGGQTNAGSRGY